MRTLILTLPSLVIGIGCRSGSASKAGDDTSSSAAGGDSAAADDCPDEDFQDVSTYDQADPYADPTLSVSCEADTLVVETNGIPNFEFVAVTPNDLSEVPLTYRIPLSPVEADVESELGFGVVGLAVNGLPIYGAFEAAPTYGDPLLDGIVDFCNGHVAPGGQYHFHGRPDCLFDEVDGQTSLVIGYGLDGYPILAPFECADADCTEVIELESSWAYIGGSEAALEANEYQEGTGDLDRCNGKTRSDGSYAYYATTTFPYLLGCHHGVVADDAVTATGGGDGGGGTDGGGGPTACSDDRDCEGVCPEGSIDCVCVDDPRAGQICAATCERDEDCLDTDGMPFICDEAQGVCVPEGGAP